jgi:hypothetical protein
VQFTGNKLVLELQQLLYLTPFIPLLPRVIFQIHQHDYRLLSGIYGNSINDPTSLGMFYSVMCGFFLFPRPGHAVQFQSSSTCPNDIMRTFLESPTEKPDACC